MQRSILLILGMGRSGTSALAGVLSLCGGSLPEKLLPAHESNLRGHWEPVEALELNDSFLFRYGSSWYDPTLLIENEGATDPQEHEAFIHDIQSLLNSWSAGSLLIIKEPRITALTKFWFEATQRAGWEIKVAIPVRHPGETCASLIARDRMTTELAQLLWLKYTLLGEQVSRPFPRVFVEFNNLIADWRKEVTRISRALSVGLSQSNAQEIDTFLSCDLYHERQTPDQISDIGPFRLSELYRELSDAARDLRLDTALFDQGFHTYATCEKLIRIGLTEFQKKFSPTTSPETTIAKLTQERDALVLELSRQKTKEQGAIEHERATHAEELARAREHCEALQAQLEAVLTSSSWRLTRPLRALRVRLAPGRR